jgi:hypothetical protein
MAIQDENGTTGGSTGLVRAPFRAADQSCAARTTNISASRTECSARQSFFSTYNPRDRLGSRRHHSANLSFCDAALQLGGEQTVVAPISTLIGTALRAREDAGLRHRGGKQLARVTGQQLRPRVI